MTARSQEELVLGLPGVVTAALFSLSPVSLLHVAVTTESKVQDLSDRSLSAGLRPAIELERGAITGGQGAEAGGPLFRRFHF